MTSNRTGTLILRIIGWGLVGAISGALLPYLLILGLSYFLPEKTTDLVNRLLDRMFGPAMGYEHTLVLMAIGGVFGSVLGVTKAWRHRA